MPTNYPSGFDAFATRGALMSDAPTHDDVHQDIEDSIEGMQATLGLNPQGVFGTVVERFNRLDLATAESAVATTPISTGRRLVTVDTYRIWTVLNNEWRIVGGNIPRVSRRIPGGNGISVASGSWSGLNVATQTTGVTGADFVSGANLVVPAGMGGDYHLSFGFVCSSASSSVAGATAGEPTVNTYRAMRCVITNNGSIGNELGTFMASAAHNNSASATPTVQLATDVRLEAGATLAFAATHDFGSAISIINYGWINLHMIAHAPALT